MSDVLPPEGNLFVDDNFLFDVDMELYSAEMRAYIEEEWTSCSDSCSNVVGGPPTLTKQSSSPMQASSCVTHDPTSPPSTPVGLGYLLDEEFCEGLEKCIQGPTVPEPLVITPETEKQMDAPGEVYLDEEFLAALGLTTGPAPPATEIDNHVSSVDTLPPPPPPATATPLPSPGHHHGRQPLTRRVKRWSKEEHELFLRGLRVYERGDWTNISRDFVKTRTPIQLASHAQKYYKWIEEKNADTNTSTRKRRARFYDMTLD